MQLLWASSKRFCICATSLFSLLRGSGNLRGPVWGALVVEAVDRRRPERGGSLYVALGETAGIGAVALLEPQRADPGQSCKVTDPVDAVEVELAGIERLSAELGAAAFAITCFS